MKVKFEIYQKEYEIELPKHFNFLETDVIKEDIINSLEIEYDNNRYACLDFSDFVGLKQYIILDIINDTFVCDCDTLEQAKKYLETQSYFDIDNCIVVNRDTFEEYSVICNTITVVDFKKSELRKE